MGAKWTNGRAASVNGGGVVGFSALAALILVGCSAAGDDDDTGDGTGGSLGPLAGMTASGTGGTASMVGSGGTVASGSGGTVASGSGGTVAAAGTGGMTAGSGGTPGTMTDGGVPGLPGDEDYAKYHDPGTGPWEMGTAADCKMDTAMIGGSDNLAVFRYGKLCHTQGGNTSNQNFSTTKTLGGVATGRAANLVKDVARTGPGTGPILHEDKAIDWLGSVSYNDEALLSHVMAMTAHNSNLAYGRKSFSYDTYGTTQITSALDIGMVAVEQLGGSVPTDAGAFMQQQVFDKLGMEESSWSGGTIGTGWIGTLEDMGRIGVMLAHHGWYGGEHFLEPRWVYRMSHSTHEDSNAAYGQLAWLNNRGGGTSFGAEIDECAPAAFWPAYPHVGSESPDCAATSGGCAQQFDVGVFSAQGLGGQFIVMHPGLDLVITAHNANGPKDLWAAVRPALVAMDPMFTGDEAAFCTAYGAGSYAPDLLVARVAPTM